MARCRAGFIRPGQWRAMPRVVHVSFAGQSPPTSSSSSSAGCSLVARLIAAAAGRWRGLLSQSDTIGERRRRRPLATSMWVVDGQSLVQLWMLTVIILAEINQNKERSISDLILYVNLRNAFHISPRSYGNRLALSLLHLLSRRLLEFVSIYHAKWTPKNRKLKIVKFKVASFFGILFWRTVFHVELPFPDGDFKRFVSWDVINWLDPSNEEISQNLSYLSAWKEMTAIC